MAERADDHLRREQEAIFHCLQHQRFADLWDRRHEDHEALRQAPASPLLAYVPGCDAWQA